MSTIAPATDDRASAHETSPAALRLRVALRRVALTRQLAEGADPANTLELTLRARQLTSARTRSQLARALRQALRDAGKPPWPRGGSAIVSRRAVLTASDEIDLLVKRLHSPEPVTTQGMALVHRILADGASSPLYGSADPGALRRLVILATAALRIPNPAAASFLRPTHNTPL